MKTFNEFFHKNETDNQIEQLAMLAEENGIPALEIISNVIEEMMIQSDDVKVKEQLALYALELQQEWGQAVGNFASGAVNFARGAAQRVGQVAQNVGRNVAQNVNTAVKTYQANQQQNRPAQPQQPAANQNQQPDLTTVLDNLRKQYASSKNFAFSNILNDAMNKVRQQMAQDQAANRNAGPTAPTV